MINLDSLIISHPFVLLRSILIATKSNNAAFFINPENTKNIKFFDERNIQVEKKDFVINVSITTPETTEYCVYYSDFDWFEKNKSIFAVQKVENEFIICNNTNMNDTEYALVSKLCSIDTSHDKLEYIFLIKILEIIGIIPEFIAKNLHEEFTRDLQMSLRTRSDVCERIVKDGVSKFLSENIKILQ